MNPRLNQPLHPSMGAAVLDYLSRMAPLPTTGVVAGQAVASALEDLYGRGGGVYNDVDVFRQLHQRTVWRKTDTFLVPTVAGQTLSLAMRPVPGSDYDVMKGDEQLVPTLVTYRAYRVEGTFRKDLLNLVLYRANGALNGDPHLVLRGFDLNCVRVGVDLASKRLCWDWHYEQFLRTSEIRIVAGQTPLHSFMRLLKKRQELPDVSANVEASAALTWLLRRPSMKELQTTGDATFWFGEKYCDLARSLGGDLKPYFKLQEQWLQRGVKGKLVRGSAGDELTAGVSLGTLVARGALSDMAGVAPHANEKLNPHVLPGQVYRSFERRASGVLVPAVPWMTKVPPRSRVAIEREVYGDGYLAGLTGLKDVRRLERDLPGVPTELSYGRSAGEMLSRLASFDQALEESGVSDREHVRKKAMLLTLPTPKEAVEAVLARERSQTLSKLGVPLIVPSEAWQQHLDAEGASVVPLRNMREAIEFAHRTGWDDSENLFRLDGVLLGAWGARDKRDAALYWFKVDETSQLIDWTFRVHKRHYMKTILEPAHVKAITALFHAFRAQGAVLPFRSKR